MGTRLHHLCEGCGRLVPAGETHRCTSSAPAGSEPPDDPTDWERQAGLALIDVLSLIRRIEPHAKNAQARGDIEVSVPLLSVVDSLRTIAARLGVHGPTTEEGGYDGVPHTRVTRSFPTR